MSFQNRNLSVIAYANGWTLWCYKTNDEILEVESANYFVPKIVDLMAKGDMIYIVSPKGTYIRVISDISDHKTTLVRTL